MKKVLTEYVKTIYALLVAFALIRFEEFLYVWWENSNNVSIELLFSRSINFDSLFLINASIFLLLPVSIMAIINRNIAVQLSRGLAISLIFIHLILTAYFVISWNVLNATVFEFSFAELSDIVSAELSSQNPSVLLAFLISFFLSIYLFFFALPKISLSKKSYQILISILIILAVVAIANRDHTSKLPRYYKSPYQYLLGNSKEVFFIQSMVSPDTNTYNLQKALAVTRTFQKSNLELEYCNPHYSLVHKEKNRNVLGKYFVKNSNINPNIIIIISESLSSSFSGPTNCINGSLTPFVDSLASKGLYWKNFLSNAEKSYGVLPSILASLPSGIGNRGFVNTRDYYEGPRKYPIHNSLIRELKNNNYHSNYYYGGWGYFDQVGFFIKENLIDTFVTSKVFNTEIYHKPEGNKIWGYNDKDLFSQSLDVVDDLDDQRPFLHIYQTLSLHSPFNLSQKKYYPEEFIDQRISELHLNPEDVKRIQNNVLSSIFFADDALRHYFNMLIKRDDFSNTIFILTGDHSINGSICQNTFENFRVPLIIFSDLLKSSEKFEGVCSHIDVLPSLIALLEDNYSLQFNSSKHWIGRGLDTNHSFVAERNIPLTINSQILPQYISGNTAIYGGKVIRFDSHFNVSDEKDPRNIYSINKLFEDYKYLNHYVCLKDKIWSTEKLCED